VKDKNEFAKESVVEDYLSDLLTESVAEESIEKEIAQKLLDKASARPALFNYDVPQRSARAKEDESQSLIADDETDRPDGSLSDQQIIEQVDKEIQSEVEIELSKAENSAPLSLKD
jgi:purine-binding chemotaxis protein CheW